MFFEVVGLAFCSCLLLILAAGAGMLAFANYHFMFTNQPRLITRLRWLVIAAAPIVTLVCVLMAWISLLGGGTSGAAVAMAIALFWFVLAGVAFFWGMSRPKVAVWTSRQSSRPDVIIYPALPDEDEPSAKL